MSVINKSSFHQGEKTLLFLLNILPLLDMHDVAYRLIFRQKKSVNEISLKHSRKVPFHCSQISKGHSLEILGVWVLRPTCTLATLTLPS